MLRRRRPPKNEAIHFSFDSFLDLVTNVVGIIIRLILVTWVGARSYHASMQWVDTAPETPPAAPAKAKEPLPPPQISDDPLYPKIEIAKRDMEEARARLAAQLKDMDTVVEKAELSKAQLRLLAGQRAGLETERKDLAAAQSQRGAKLQQVSLSADEIRQRTKKLLEDIKKLEAHPIVKKEFKYHAPISQAVHSEELFFECKDGRVTYIDLPAFQLEIKQALEGLAVELRTRWQVERTTSQLGPYRLRYTVERERGGMDVGPTPSGTAYRYGLIGWTVEPLTPDRGETLAKALAPKSEFRQIVDPLDDRISTVTFWVYPESFEMFRQLRDYLYERGLNVAGRPLTPGAPIAAARNGTASRGQ
jgi:hypothetical protein